MTKIPSPPMFMSVKDVALHFDCAVSTVWRWTKNGVLPKPLKIGGMTRWRADDVLSAFSGTV